MPDSVPLRSDPHVRRRSRRRSGSRLPWLLAAGVLLAAGLGGSLWFRAARSSAHELAGYINDDMALEREYARFLGHPLKDSNLEDQFQQAARLVRSRDYRGAVAALEPLATQAPVPVVFNNLGVLYEQLNDRARAINSFREALSRDSGYQPVRQTLRNLKGLAPGAADPVTQEVEPNNSPGLANLIPLDTPVDAAIAGLNDEDYFRFTAPPAPRDLIEIRLDNRSQTLAPGLAVFDSDRRLVGWGKDTRDAGASVVQYLPPAPNTILYLQIWGHRGTEGNYALTVHPMKAFDAYEPNDDIFSATQIAAGKTIEANIMDDHDTDYYVFEAPATGTADIVVENLSSTLIPALSTFSGDRRFIAFGPDIRTAGASLKHAMAVDQGRKYYLQVWSQASSRGAYKLTVK